MKYIMERRTKTIAFDFDNVIHKYREGWKDGSIYDELNPNILKLIGDLLHDGHYVFILTTRSRFQVKRFLENMEDMSFGCEPGFEFQTFWKFKKFWNKKGVCGICNHKAVFDLLIDDRAVTFNPLVGITKKEILDFKITTYAN